MALSDSEPVIPFAFSGKEAMANAVGYTKLAFAFLYRGYLLVLVHLCLYQRRERQDIYWEEKVKGGKASITRRRVEVGRGGGKFLLQLFLQGDGMTRASGKMGRPRA